MGLKVILATLFCLVPYSTLVRADLFGVTVDGKPLARGATVPKTATFRGVDKDPNKDLLLFLYVTPPQPPTQPATFRVVQPNGNITVIPNANLFVQPPKQRGSGVEIYYKGETNPIVMKGALLSPGDPNPSPLNDDLDQELLGQQEFLTPAEALVAISDIIAQPDSALIFGNPIPLSYFDYDFTGTVDFPVFEGGVTLLDSAGNTNFIGFAPEPSTGPLVTAFFAAALLLRRRARRGRLPGQSRAFQRGVEGKNEEEWSQMGRT